MSKTLLLADDSVTIQKVVGISFANEDVRIVTVDNGDDAVVRAREIKPDIVLADVVMPGKSGYDVCAALKSDPELRGVPVLLLTGTFETFDEDRAARVGADGHITKPFEAQALVELVNARLAGAAPPARAPKPAAAGRPAPVAAEPEPFDFLEPEQVTLPRRRTGTAEPVARTSVPDAFAFEGEPIDAGELEAGDDDPLGLGSEATEARTTLLLEDDPLAEAETAPPAGFSARDFDDDERTSLVLPEGRSQSPERPAPPAPPAPPPLVAAVEEAVDPLEGVFDPVLDDESALPRASRAYDVASPDVDDPYRTRVLDEAGEPARDVTPRPGFAEPLFDDDLAAAHEFDLPAPPAAAAAPHASGVDPKAVTPPTLAKSGALSPELSGQVHETLEKVAWEAFGDLSERIVREAVQRIEQVAWDVIPRLAETLIREEIRKLKGEE
jgi:CheY-like chemotaxis protein